MPFLSDFEAAIAASSASPLQLRGSRPPWDPVHPTCPGCWGGGHLSALPFPHPGWLPSQCSQAGGYVVWMPRALPVAARLSAVVELL